MKLFARAALAVSAIIISSLSLPSALAESPQRIIGEEIAARACAGCHGLAASTGVTIQGVYVPSFSEIANRPNQSRDRLQSLITMPRHPMTSPALGDRELRQLAEYILSFKTH